MCIKPFEFEKIRFTFFVHITQPLQSNIKYNIIRKMDTID